jgi:hypothetical protein
MASFLNFIVMGTLILLPSVGLSQTPKEEDLRASGAKRLTTDEVGALHSNRTVYHHNIVSGLRLPMWYAADGTRSLRVGNRNFSGAWTARDNGRCEETVGGPVVCMAIYKSGEEWVLCDPREAPECRWRITRSVDGDVERLSGR